jgi:hypothetical protein
MIVENSESREEFSQQRYRDFDGVPLRKEFWGSFE